MITLTRYFSLKLLWTTLGVTFVFAALIQILDLLDVTDDILSFHGGLSGFAFYIVARLPSILSEVLPLSVLIGALFTLVQLVRNGEIVVLRAAGVPVSRMIAAMVPAVLALALAHFAIADQLRPRAEGRLAGWWTENMAKVEPVGNPVWLKVDGAVVQIERVRDRGRRLEGLRIYNRDTQDAVTARTTAAVAHFRGTEWMLDGAETTDWRREHLDERTPADGEWRTKLRPSNVLEALMPEIRVSAATARAVTSGRRVAAGAVSIYATALQRAFAEPLISLVMLLLAAPIAFVNKRGSQIGRYFLMSLGLGLVFLLADGLYATLGRAGVIDPVLASWTPAVGFTILGFTLLRVLEHR